MITSVEFPKNSKDGFINEKIYTPMLRKNKTKEEYDEVIKNRNDRNFPYHWKQQSEIFAEFYKNVPAGYKNETMRTCCRGKKFEFNENKINIIFGPNASGKTTILNHIALTAMCGDGNGNIDGWTNPNAFRPSDFWSLRDDNEQTVNDLICQKKGCDSDIVWDGAPVYYYNFNNRRVTGSFEDIQGSMFESFSEGTAFMFESKTMSGAQKNLYKINKLAGLIGQNITIEDIINNAIKSTSGYNDTWKDNTKLGIKYIRQFITDNPGKKTLLIDEVDNTLDISVMVGLYKTFLPKLSEHAQLIIVSHNPLVLSDICDPEKYNIVSMSDKYTKSCREYLRGVNFL